MRFEARRSVPKVGGSTRRVIVQPRRVLYLLAVAFIILLIAIRHSPDYISCEQELARQIDSAAGYRVELVSECVLAKVSHRVSRAGRR